MMIGRRELVAFSHGFSISNKRKFRSFSNTSKGSFQEETNATVGPRRRSRKRSRLGMDQSNQNRNHLMKDVPSLKEFIHTTTVLRLYRTFLRTVRGLGSDAKEEVQKSFRTGAIIKKGDPAALAAIREGERRLQEIQSMIGYKGPSHSSLDKSKDEDSWLNIDDKEDPRGRVGVQWPWQRTEE